MSYTEIFGFDKEGNAYYQANISNAWRGGMAIWNILEERYLPPHRPSYVPAHIPDEKVESFLSYKPRRTADMMNRDAMKEIWDLFNNEKVSLTDKIVLGTTFDRVIVKKEDFSKLIEAFEAFEGETSLKEQAAVIKEMAVDDGCIAVGWNQTSVNGDTWANFGGYDEEADEAIPYSLNTVNEHWYLFDELTA